MATKKRSKGTRAKAKGARAERVSAAEEKKRKKRAKPVTRKRPSKPPAKKASHKGRKGQKHKPATPARSRGVKPKPKKRAPSKRKANLSTELGRAFGIAMLMRMAKEQERRIDREREQVEREHREGLARVEKLRQDQEREGFVRPEEYIRRDGTPASHPSFLRHLDNTDELIHFLETGERNFETPLLGLIADIDKKVIYDQAKFKEIAEQIKAETGARSLKEVYTLFYSP